MVIRPLNAVSENQPYLRNDNAYTNLKLDKQIEHEDSHLHARWPPCWKLRVAGRTACYAPPL